MSKKKKVQDKDRSGFGSRWGLSIINGILTRGYRHSGMLFLQANFYGGV